MVTAQTQIKINLPLALKELLQSKAARFGIPLASYIKHLAIKDVEDTEYPEFEPSERTIKAYKRAIKNKDKAVVVENIDQFFKNL